MRVETKQEFIEVAEIQLMKSGYKSHKLCWNQQRSICSYPSCPSSQQWSALRSSFIDTTDPSTPPHHAAYPVLSSMQQQSSLLVQSCFGSLPTYLRQHNCQFPVSLVSVQPPNHRPSCKTWAVSNIFPFPCCSLPEPCILKRQLTVSHQQSAVHHLFL